MMGRIAGAVALASLSACAGAPGPDTVLVNGKVFTANAQAPWAQAVAITGDRITGVGDTAAINAMAASNTRRIDLGGRTVVPGFNDAHTHIRIAPPLDQLTLPLDPTIEEIAGALRAQIKTTAAGRLIYGEFGAIAWDNPAFARAWLDAIAPDHPVWLVSFTGHGMLTNSRGLVLAGVGETMPEILGGVSGRDPGGRLNGRFEEYAEYYLHRRFAMKLNTADAANLYRQYAAEARTFGITSTQLLGDSLLAADASKALVAADAPMRWKYFRFPIVVDGETQDSRPALPPQPTALIDMRGMKWVLDGTPIERLGFNRAPYADAPERGRLNFPAARIDQFVGWAYGSEDPLAVHAFGDGTIEAYVAAIEREALRKCGAPSGPASNTPTCWRPI